MSACPQLHVCMSMSPRLHLCMMSMFCMSMSACLQVHVLNVQVYLWHHLLYDFASSCHSHLQVPKSCLHIQVCMSMIMSASVTMSKPKYLDDIQPWFLYHSVIFEKKHHQQEWSSLTWSILKSCFSWFLDIVSIWHGSKCQMAYARS